MYQKGEVVKKDIEKAAKFYARAIDEGSFYYKKYLDGIYDSTVEFKAKNPQYKKIDKDNKKFLDEKMKIIL